MKPKREFETQYRISWCPGCPNHIILEAAREALINLKKQGYDARNFAMACGVGCHGKIFDYLDISGIYGLHGRTIPTAIGMKLGNPNLTVLAFAGDGDTYSEGISHFIHACRFNPDITLIVHDNQTFSLTTGQATPTSQKGFKNKAEPMGELNDPINPIKLALSAGASFIARANARDLQNTKEMIERGIKHRGFSFIEVLQDCIIFNLEINNKDKSMYKLSNKKRSYQEAISIADEWNYNTKQGKIALGVIYEEKKPVLDEKWPILSYLKSNNLNWKTLKK